MNKIKNIYKNFPRLENTKKNKNLRTTVIENLLTILATTVLIIIFRFMNAALTSPVITLSALEYALYILWVIIAGLSYFQLKAIYSEDGTRGTDLKKWILAVKVWVWIFFGFYSPRSITNGVTELKTSLTLKHTGGGNISSGVQKRMMQLLMYPDLGGRIQCTSE